MKKRKKKSGSSEVACEYKPPYEKTGGWSDYEVRDSLSTLMTAAKIRKNKALMAAVRAESRKAIKVAEDNAATIA